MSFSAFSFTGTLLFIFALQAPAHSGIIHLSCKTDAGESSTTYYIDIDKETVKDLSSSGKVEQMRTLLFTPSTINFEDSSFIDVLGRFIDIAWKHQIDRTNFKYLVEMNVRYDPKAVYEKTLLPGVCKIVKTPKALF